jgi:hypothetical protein
MTKDELDIIANDSTFSRTLQVPVPSHIPDLVLRAADRWKMTPTEYLRSLICERLQLDGFSLASPDTDPDERRRGEAVAAALKGAV